MKKSMTYGSLLRSLTLSLSLSLSLLLPNLAWASGSMEVDGVSIPVPSDRYDTPGGMIEHLPVQETLVSTPNPQGNKGGVLRLNGRISFKEICNNTSEKGKHYIEVKFYPYSNSSSSSLDTFFDRTLYADNREVLGTTPNHIVEGIWGINSIYFQVYLTLKDDAYYQTGDQRLAAGEKVLLMSMFCRNATLSGGFSEQTQFHNKFTVYRVKLAKQIDYSLNRTCTMIDQDQTVTLRKVLVSEFANSNDIKGGSFNIKLDCNLADVNTAYISFSDGKFPTTGNPRDYLTGRGIMPSVNVGVKIKDTADNQFLLFGGAEGALPTQNMIMYSKAAYPRMKLFEQNVRGSQVSHTYDVYYTKVRPRTNVGVGKVDAKLLYNFYYH